MGESSTSSLIGDTIEIDGASYRIYGIDAPEAGQTCASSSGKTWPCALECLRGKRGLEAAGQAASAMT